jgi:hypothetical protein
VNLAEGHHLVRVVQGRRGGAVRDAERVPGGPRAALELLVGDGVGGLDLDARRRDPECVALVLRAEVVRDDLLHREMDM